MIKRILTVLWIVKLCSTFDVFTDLAYEDPLSNYADNFNNRLAGLAQECTSINAGETVFGTCRHSVHCRLLGGTPWGRGTCSSIFDSCCAVNRGCGRITKTRVSTFGSPTTMPQQSLECSYTTFLVNSNVCQVRIDFNTTMTEPNLEEPNIGQCMQDKISFMDGENAQTPDICGRNMNQHIYLRVDKTLNFVVIRAHLASRLTNPTLQDSKWTLKLTQLECPGINTQLLNPYKRIQAAVDYPNLAPQGCLQYFIPTEGNIQTFNTDGLTNEPPPTGIIQPNQDYSICFYSPPGSCGVTLTTLRMNVNSPTTNAILHPDSIAITFPGVATTNTPGPFFIRFQSVVVVRTEHGFNLQYSTINRCV